MINQILISLRKKAGFTHEQLAGKQFKRVHEVIHAL